MKQGFWSLLEELAPSLPDKGHLDWTASVEAIRSHLSAGGLKCPPSVVEMALESADEWNPGFPWLVERVEGDRYIFRRRL